MVPAATAQNSVSILYHYCDYYYRLHHPLDLLCCVDAELPFSELTMNTDTRMRRLKILQWGEGVFLSCSLPTVGVR
jgi:hypothetical protein